MKIHLPPHIAWPALVVGLLLMGVASTFGVMIASRSDGGVQVLDDYYRQAVAWDSVAAARQAGQGLGWTLAATVAPAGVQGREVHVRVHDAAGAPVNGLSGTVWVSRPQWAGVLAEAPLTATAESGGYVAHVPVQEPGLWDLEIQAMRSGQPYWVRRRVEVRQ